MNGGGFTNLSPDIESPSITLVVLDPMYPTGLMDIPITAVIGVVACEAEASSLFAGVVTEATTFLVFLLI
jgi:hypothetical protein